MSYTCKIFRQRRDFWNEPRDQANVPGRELIATVSAPANPHKPGALDEIASGYAQDGYFITVELGTPNGTLKGYA